MIELFETNNSAGQFTEELIQNARKIASPGKGILAADESTGTIGQRFSKIGVENNPENRRAYRELLFGAEGLGEVISGAILFSETFGQLSADGVLLPQLLLDQGILPGIKVDAGLKNIPGTSEQLTQGLDNLDVMCKEYYGKGARFAKWRAVYSIAEDKPSLVALDTQSRNLALYASICQANGLVPIVEPEVLMDGTHSIQVCADVSQRVYASVVGYLHDYNVLFEGMLLKPNMVCPGADGGIKSSPEEIAWYTVRTLKRTIPSSVPGIMFLSGGQSEEEASLNLNAINRIPHTPWILSFSYGRALQASVLKAWLGKAENVQAARERLLFLARNNSLAQRGQYLGGGEGGDSLFQSNYSY